MCVNYNFIKLPFFQQFLQPNSIIAFRELFLFKVDPLKAYRGKSSCYILEKVTEGFQDIS